MTKKADWKTILAALSGALLAAVPILSTGGAWWVALIAALGAAGTAAVGTESVRARSRDRAAERASQRVDTEPREVSQTQSEIQSRDRPTRSERTVPDDRQGPSGRAPDRHGRY